MNPKYPIYIISKGRAESRQTSKALERMKVPYRIVIEPQEFDEYAEVIDEKKILVLPFSNLGQGSIPVRNWVWDHSTNEGHKRHWIMDDNIAAFCRLNRNRKIRVADGTIIRCCERFTDRYENVPMSGMNYRFFAPERSAMPPYYLNTRVYSCILLSNDDKHRLMWRGKYNEDTDLSLRFLKAGYCTILYNAFLCDKAGTLTMKGGNTGEVYGDTNDRMEFAQSLKDQHPDCVEIARRWDRWHHVVDYSKFSVNKLALTKDANIAPNKVNEYGMELLRTENKKTK